MKNREWYGPAPWPHPRPASLSTLTHLFPSITPALSYRTSIMPALYGENLTDLHDRCAYALASIIADADAFISEKEKREGKAEEESILICTHAAAILAIGRTLVGHMPKDPSTTDFHAYTCGVSRFDRIKSPTDVLGEGIPNWKEGDKVPDQGWRAGKGVRGGWECVEDSRTDFLEGGAERNWGFTGEEGFMQDNFSGKTAEVVGEDEPGAQGAKL
jgi:transcription factor C subunit 7